MNTREANVSGETGALSKVPFSVLLRIRSLTYVSLAVLQHFGSVQGLSALCLFLLTN